MTEMELHEILPHQKGDFSTKLHCTCGYESASQAEQWLHAATTLREALVLLTEAVGSMHADITEGSPSDVWTQQQVYDFCREAFEVLEREELL